MPVRNFNPLGAGVLYQVNRNLMGMGTSAADTSRQIPGLNGRMSLLPSQNGQSAPTYQQNTLRMIAGSG